MKKTAYIILSVLSLACSCSKSPIGNAPEGSGIKTWTFTAEPVSRAVIADGGAFSWTPDDEIRLWDSRSSRYVVFTDRAGKGVFTAEAPEISVFQSAVYPASVAATTASVSLPEGYTAAEAAAGKVFPMWAEVQENTNALSFSHLGAVLRFTVKNVIPGMTKIRVSSGDGSLSGTFPVSGSPLQIAQQAGSGAVTIDLGTVPDHSDFVVSIPVPVGSYNYRIEVGNDSESGVYSAYTTSPQSFERKKIYKLGELNFYRGNVLLESGLEGEDFTVEPDDPYAWR